MPSDQNTFKYPEEHGLQVPLLVVAIKQQDGLDYKFNEPEKWLRITHQVAGHGCHQVNLLAMPLEPNEITMKLMLKLEETFFESDLGCLGLALQDVVSYNELLREYGLHCEASFQELKEAVYPIDCTEEHIRLLCKNKLPKNMDDLINWEENHLFRLLGCINRWHLFIIGNNCD